MSLSLRLATTPCGPLYKRDVSQDRELAAVVSSILTGEAVPGESGSGAE